MAVGAGSLDVADRTSFVVRRRAGVNGPPASVVPDCRADISPEVSFDPADRYSIPRSEQGVRGQTTVTSFGSRAQVACECTVDLQRTWVFTADYRAVSSTGDPVQLDGLSVGYQDHVPGHGWMDWVRDGEPAGTTGRDLRIEALCIELENRGTTGVACQVHIAGRGWSDWVDNGAVAGTTGEERRLEAVRVRLVDPPKCTRLRYQVHAQGVGWMEWVDEGELAGATGQSRRLEAIRVELVRDSKPGIKPPGLQSRPRPSKRSTRLSCRTRP